MVSCDLCGASPTGTDAVASPTGTDAEAGAHARVQRRHHALVARADAGADAGALPKGARAHADASPIGANAHGAAEADATVPLSWVVSVEAGGTRTYCETCAREHLRSIEAKLDSPWW